MRTAFSSFLGFFFKLRCQGHDHWFHWGGEKGRVTFQTTTLHFFPLDFIFFKNTSKEFIIVFENERDGKQETTAEPRFNEGPRD